MKGNFLIALFGVILLSSLFGCSEENGETNANVEINESASNEVVAEANNANNSEEESNDEKALTLPDSFPADFPLPDTMVITDVKDDSDEEGYSYSITFTFDPELDLDALFEKYSKYTEDIGYEVIIGGEEYFAEGIFQYGANKEMSTDDMFVITLKPEDGTYGSIDIDISK